MFEQHAGVLAPLAGPVQEDDQRVFLARFDRPRGDEQVAVLLPVRPGVGADLDAGRDLGNRVVPGLREDRGGGEQQGGRHRADRLKTAGSGANGGAATPSCRPAAGGTSVAGAVRLPSPAAAPIPAALCAAAALCVAAADPPDPARPDRVVVLAGGRVYTGAVRQQPNGVEVRQANGRLTLPRELVRVTAPTLAEAHEKLLAETDATNPDALADLAGWCHTNGLSETARGHLVAALTLNPARDDLRRTLARVEASIGARRVRLASHEEAAPAAPVPAGGGVSRAALGAFTRTVEPIVVARCGNAACHGGGDRNRRPFRLTTPSRSPIATRRNLAAAAAFVGDGTPAGSPLLSSCPSRPDRFGRTPFAGVGGADSYRHLAAWAAAVAAERGESGGDTPGVADSPETPAAPPAADAFDPAAFNRRFAPPAAAPPRTGDGEAPADPPAVSPATPPQP